MGNVLLVFAGGGAGAALRFLLSTGVQRTISGEFPLGTLTVNLLGCLLAGALWAWAGTRGLPFSVSVFLFSGFLGGFTTFSAFGLETFALLTEGRWVTAAAYVLVSNLCGLLLATGGYWGMLRLLHK